MRSNPNSKIQSSKKCAEIEKIQPFQKKKLDYLELLGALPNDAKAELVRGYLAANQMLDYLFEQTKGE